MADSPVPGGAQRGVVTAPNTGAGDRANDGAGPLARHSGVVHASNYGPGGDRRGGTADLRGGASPVAPPNHQFVVGMGNQAASEK